FSLISFVFKPSPPHLSKSKKITTLLLWKERLPFFLLLQSVLLVLLPSVSQQGNSRTSSFDHPQNSSCPSSSPADLCFQLPSEQPLQSERWIFIDVPDGGDFNSFLRNLSSAEGHVSIFKVLSVQACWFVSLIFLCISTCWCLNDQDLEKSSSTFIP
ncbi:hypothetical protein LINGRAHAP2_LOCUS28993, partial [Linum grandiflorum]